MPFVYRQRLWAIQAPPFNERLDQQNPSSRGGGCRFLSGDILLRRRRRRGSRMPTPNRCAHMRDATIFSTNSMPSDDRSADLPSPVAVSWDRCLRSCFGCQVVVEYDHKHIQMTATFALFAFAFALFLDENTFAAPLTLLHCAPRHASCL